MKSQIYICIALTLMELKMPHSAMAQRRIPTIPVPVRTCPGFTSKFKGRVGCTEEKGEDVGMEMDIRFKEPVQTIHAELHAVVFGLPIKWDGVNPYACDDIVSVGKCPFEESDFTTYGVKLHVNQTYPPVTADVCYTIRDQSEDVQVCWIVKAVVV